MDRDSVIQTNDANLQWLEAFSGKYPRVDGVDVLRAFSYELISYLNRTFLENALGKNTEAKA